jgi:glyoxylase-like metal-dependent hydrolase (beta-lactamase superfamily II)
VESLGAGAPRIPFPIYLVEHPDGVVLFDAGLDPDHAGDPVGGYGEVAERIRIDFREEHLDFDDRHGINWVEISGDYDVFGDGAVQVLHLPRHTPGSLGLLVRLPGQTRAER